MKKTAAKTTKKAAPKTAAKAMSLGAQKRMGLKRSAKNALAEVGRVIHPKEGTSRRKGAARAAMPLTEAFGGRGKPSSGRRGSKGMTTHAENRQKLLQAHAPKIEKGIPISDTPQRRSWGWVKQMNVGDSFLLEPRDARQGGSIATRLQSLTGYTFTTRKKGDAVRVHRVA
jgi:hypothetical protein